MVNRLPQLGIVLVALMCVAALFNDNLIQQGYQAYLEQRFDQAIRCYEQALAESADPGRIAHELGTLHASAGHYQQSAIWFARSLEDANGWRRCKSAYGQATALIYVAASQQGRRSVATLQRVLAGYDLARREAQSLTVEEKIGWPTFLEDVEVNRAMAEQLLARKLKEPDPPEDEQTPPATNPMNTTVNDSGTNPATGSRALPANTQRPPAGENAGTSEDSNPGRGNLPPLPDDPAAPPVSPEEAQRRLNELLKRLQRPLTLPPVQPGTRDW